MDHLSIFSSAVLYLKDARSGVLGRLYLNLAGFMTKLNVNQKLIIVSNRLPVSVAKENGKLVYTSSSGGLATAMSSLDIDPANRIWIGWPGIPSDDLTSADRTKITKKLRQFGCFPVYLTRKQVRNFYSGYANDTIWPLFHYFQSYTQHNSEFWSAYKEVNTVFRNAVIRQAMPDSLIWIHDYHLMLLPRELRKSLPKSAIGFFLHIPFPSYEIFRQLPNRSEILDGLLGADLIGFHIYDYARHFLSSVLRAVGIESKQGTITAEGRTIKTDAFPIGIDYDKFFRAARASQKTEMAKTLYNIYSGQKVILSVDRLDYSKGILKRLEAFELLLKDSPSLIKKVTLVVIAVPSRIEVETYKDLRDAIELTVSRINGTYSTVDWTPISYQFKNLPFEELVALYARADIALVTPLRDGMNLVAKEYIASKFNNLGVLILSEMAGAIDELHEAVKVNPNDIDSIVRSIKKALRMTKKEQRVRILSMKSRISQYTVQRWASDFIGELVEIKKAQAEQNKKVITSSHIGEILTAFNSAKSRTLFLDYDGTLRQFSKDFGSSRTAPPKSLLKILNNLSSQPNTEVCIISGRPHDTLEKWFGDMPINLVAEHGAWIKEDGKWEHKAVSFQDFKKDLLPVLKHYAERTPGARVEEKSSALVWHYRNVPTELAYTRRASLRRDLRKVIDKNELGIYNGNKIIEIKSRHIHKGKIISKALKQHPSEFILCIGDDYTDEDMYRALPEEAYSIKVGYEDTNAKLQIQSVEKVLQLIKLLADT